MAGRGEGVAEILWGTPSPQGKGAIVKCVIGYLDDRVSVKC